MSHHHQHVVTPGTACETGVKVEAIVSLRGMGDLTLLFQADVAGVLYIQPLRPPLPREKSATRTPYSVDEDDDGVPETWPAMAESDTVVADTPMTLMLANLGFVDAKVGFRPAGNGTIAFFDAAVLPV